MVNLITFIIILFLIVCFFIFIYQFILRHVNTHSKLRIAKGKTQGGDKVFIIQKKLFFRWINAKVDNFYSLSYIRFGSKKEAKTYIKKHKKNKRNINNSKIVSIEPIGNSRTEYSSYQG